MSKVGFRLSRKELEKISNDAGNTLLEKVRILELLFNNPTGMLRRNIQAVLYPEFAKCSTKKRILIDRLNELIDSELITTKKFNQRDILYLLPVKDESRASLKYDLASQAYLDDWIPLLKQYDFIPFVDDLLSIIEKNNLSNYKSIDFPMIDFIGTQYIKKIYSAIKEGLLISFQYQKKHEKDLKSYYDFQPILLKLHENRWYMVGLFQDSSKEIIFSVENIRGEIDALIDKPRMPRRNAESVKYWKHSSGIYTAWMDSDKKHDSSAKWVQKPIQISFLVRDGDKFDNISYLETDPIHNSQEIHPDKQNIKGENYARVTLNMYPDSDMIRRIRSIGEHCIKELQPDKIKKWAFEL